MKDDARLSPPPAAGIPLVPLPYGRSYGRVVDRIREGLLRSAAARVGTKAREVARRA
jgi:hypothetical protein